MAQQTINVGAAPNDGTGTPLRTAFQYTNSNFTELYTALGGGSGLPGASSQVIFNDGGTNLAGSAGLVFNKTTSVLGVGTVNAGAAIVSGDLTVDTSTLKVDSANDRVGIGIATPAWPLDIRSATAVAQILSTTGTNAAYLQVSNTGGIFYLGRENSAGTSFASPAYSAVLYAGGAYPLVTTVNGSERYRIASDGVATWSNVGGVATTAMTLNSTGLGIGATPTQKLHVKGVVNFEQISGGTNVWQLYTYTDGTYRMNYNGAGADELIIDTSGNVGIGVAPSAWNSAAKALQIGSYAAFATWNNATGSANNTYLNSSSAWMYLNGAAASLYYQISGAHIWQTAPSGPINTQITFNERLRLKEPGQLRFVPLAADPTGAEAGDVYYNSTSNKLKCYNGTTWNDLF